MDIRMQIRQGGREMENNLLFINQNKDIIQEFLAAMEGKEEPMAIDTADSGLEAAFLLKKKIYFSIFRYIFSFLKKIKTK